MVHNVRLMVPFCAVALAGGPLTAQSTVRVPGITYAIDSGLDAGAAPGVFKQLVATVVFANGRGRIDIIGVSESPRIRADGIPISVPFGRVGDYYLFDSTGFILVRPATRTFSTVSIDDEAFNYQDRRDGWPAWFELHVLRIDTLASGDSVDSRAVRQARTQLFWHLDLLIETTPKRPAGRDSIRILAAGHLAVRDFPAGEASVFRWFGPSQAVANLPDSAGGLPTGRVRITAVAVLIPPDGGGDPINVITQHKISGLMAAQVELSRLVLPAGFTETAWPGNEKVFHAGSPSRDSGAKWRAAP
jgi:hypothetical protein